MYQIQSALLAPILTHRGNALTSNQCLKFLNALRHCIINCYSDFSTHFDLYAEMMDNGLMTPVLMPSYTDWHPSKACMEQQHLSLNGLLSTMKTFVSIHTETTCQCNISLKRTDLSIVESSILKRVMRDSLINKQKKVQYKYNR